MITSLPTPPSTADSANFNVRANAFLGALPLFAEEANSLASDINDLLIDTQASAAAALISENSAADTLTETTAIKDLAQAAANSAGAVVWVSGNSYATGDLRYSPIDYQTYRCKISGTSSTDPSIDTTRWVVQLGTRVLDWVSGTTYAVGDLRYSPIDFQTYRRKTSGAGTTDPSADATNWAKLMPVVQDYQEFLTSGTWTKPTNANWVYVEAIGGGASGTVSSTNANSGGGGGGFNAKILRAIDVTATVAVTIGGGGLATTTETRNAGGNSTFGGYVTAKGAPGGKYYQSEGGGGEFVATQGKQGGYSSGSGGQMSPGGNCVKGGAGGGSSFAESTAGGVSIDGGNGGAGSTGSSGGPGSVPGGGGGSSASGTAGAGGAGRVRVWAW